MADTPISGLAAVTDVLDTDEYVLARAGLSKKIDAVDLRAGIGGWTTVLKTADESVASSTTTQNDDELFFVAALGAVYEIEGILYYVSVGGGGAPDLKTDWGEDATARGSIYIPGHSNTDTNFTGAADTNQTATIILGTAATPRLARFQGGHVGNGGTFRLRWAQYASGVNATVVKAGSVLRYRRLI